MAHYTTPEMEVVRFQYEDVITTSGVEETSPDGQDIELEPVPV